MFPDKIERQPEASLPVRERGLKRRTSSTIQRMTESLPVRERGLKRRKARDIVHADIVAPRAGAWIETTSKCEKLDCATRSLPVRERGLKP